MIEAGTVLQDRYRVEKQIGQGGMGAVFVATDERFGSTVAIKETLMLDEKFRRAFEREARLLNSLRHPALPRVSDHFVDGDGQFLVMEYIDGEDLSEMMEHEGRTFPVKDVLNWADQLLDALEYLHTQEMPVIHRDIKPQNLKLNSRGQIILLDFGLAKGNATNPESNTAAKSVFGYSRNYASLEQIQGTGTDPRSDLYSLAATLYHLLTGVPPADALTRAMNVLSDKADPLVEMNAINPDIPAPVGEILHKAMALNANQRPISAQAMRALLWESEELVEAGAKTTPDKRAAANLFTQKTAVLGDAGSAGQAAVKTEVLSENPSKETAVKTSATGDFEAEKTKIQTQPEASRRTVFSAKIVAAAILAVMSCAALIYTYSRMWSGAGSDAANTEQKLNSVTVSEANANSANSNVIAVIQNANVSPEAAQNEAKQTQIKPAETTRSETKNQTTGGQSSQTSQTRVGEIPTVKPVPKPNEAQTNDGDDEDAPDTEADIPPAVLQKMTPLQRRQLRLALQMQRQQREIEKRKREQQQRQEPQATPH